MKMVTRRGIEEVTPDWFERADGAAIEVVDEARLRDAVGPSQAATLRTTRPERVTEEAATLQRDLPDIVLVHGFLGGHLDDAGVASRRTWLSAWTFVRDFARELTLADNGDDSLEPERSLQAAGLLQFFYRSAAHAWRQQGFVVHEFAFDWRKRIEQSADRLHYTIESLALLRRNKIALVAHSMGASVACLYAQRHTTWQERIQSAILVGPPLHGTY